MKKFENISEFENLLKDQLGGHSTPPPADVWTNVAASTTAQSASILSQVTGFLGSTTNLVKVALFAGGIAAAGIAIYNENRSSNTAENSSTPNSEQPKVESVLADSAESISKIDYQTTTITADNTKSEPIDSKSSESSTSTKTETNSNGLVNNNPNQSSSDINRADVKSTDSNPTKENTSTESKLTVEVSDLKPCIGQVITLSCTKPGDWSVNQKQIGKNIKSIKYECKTSGKQTVIYTLKEQTISRTIYVQEIDLKLLSKGLKNDEHSYAISNSSIIANWYVDGKLLSTNGNAFNTKINGVGKHIIKADPLNHPCAAPLTLEETIEPIGRVEFFNIFTPDGDGKNDRYFVEIEKYENFSIQIFDEAGSTVYTSQNPQEGWDGTVFNNGNKCRAGAYTAKISYTLIGESPTVKSQRLQLRRQ